MQQLIRVPRAKHSEKPIEVLRAIEKMFPSQQRIELFARKKFPGWAVWGLEVPASQQPPTKQRQDLVLN
jgi:N6-adenosine-specific RNA methylase IME4